MNDRFLTDRDYIVSNF